MTPPFATSRRGFLTAVGITTAGVASLRLLGSGAVTAGAAPAATTTVDGFTARHHRTYRLATFRRRKTFTSGKRTFVVERRKPITGVTGERMFERNAFEVIFRQTAGPAAPNGTLTLTPEKGEPFLLHLTDQGSGRYSAVINRYQES